MTRIVFVCMGNICRSPTAEAVMRHVVEKAGRQDEFRLDSAGTGGWHVGGPPDPRSISEARRRGIDMSGAARQVSVADFKDFDLLVAMDSDNARNLRRMAPSAEAREKVVMLRSFAPDSVAHDLDVPDPYYGGGDGFRHVFDLVEVACAGLLEAVVEGRA